MKTPLASLFVLFLCGDLFAKTQTFTFVGTGSGSLGATTFVDAGFKVTAIGDTEDRLQIPGTNAFYIDHSEASIEIDGIGKLAFEIPTRTLFNTQFRIVAFSAQFENTDLVQLRDNAPLGNWDLVSSIGPLTGYGRNLGWWRLSVLTDAGVLSFDDAEGFNMTFSSTVVPEPSSFCLCIGSIVLLGIGRRVA